MIMSKFLVISIMLLSFSVSTKAQAIDTATVEQYASVNVYPSAFSNKVKIEQDFGDFMSLYKDHRLRDEFGKVRKFNTAIDALNYMGSTGWTLVSGMPITTAAPNYVSYLFKRRFKKSDLEEKQ